MADDDETTANEAASVTESNLELGDLEGGPDKEDIVPFDARASNLSTPSGARDLEAVYEIPVQVAAVLGKSQMQVSQLLKMGRGAIVELDRKVGEAIDIYVNNRLVARGEVVVVDDRLGVTMTEIIKSEKSSQ
jgi:flagellar motor switch protein FliN/FliY